MTIEKWMKQVKDEKDKIRKEVLDEVEKIVKKLDKFNIIDEDDGILVEDLLKKIKSLQGSEDKQQIQGEKGK